MDQTIHWTGTTKEATSQKNEPETSLKAENYKKSGGVEAGGALTTPRPSRIAENKNGHPSPYRQE
jgi:hypothetical protein